MASLPTSGGGYLPIQLNYGLIAIYHISAVESSINHIQAPKNFNWGSIYQISPYGIPSYRSVGQSVLFGGEDVICTLTYATVGYPIIEQAKLVTIELGSSEPEP